MRKLCAAFAWVVFVCLLFLTTPLVSGGTISVSPGLMHIQDVEPGVVYDVFECTGTTLQVFNKTEDTPQKYKIGVRVGQRLRTGYNPLPDPTWFWFDRQEVEVDPGGTGLVKMFFKVPEGDEYYNQHFGTGVSVEAVPGPGQFIALALYPVFYIETLPKGDLGKVRPFGPLGVSPSEVTLDGVRPGLRTKGEKVMVYNNEEVARTYSVKGFVPGKGTELKHQIFQTKGHFFLPDPSWIGLDKEVLELEPGGVEELKVWIDIPKDEKGVRWPAEALLLIESIDNNEEKGRVNRAAFVRIKMTPSGD